MRVERLEIGGFHRPEQGKGENKNIRPETETTVAVNVGVIAVKPGDDVGSASDYKQHQANENASCRATPFLLQKQQGDRYSDQTQDYGENFINRKCFLQKYSFKKKVQAITAGAMTAIILALSGYIAWDAYLDTGDIAYESSYIVETLIIVPGEVEYVEPENSEYHIVEKIVYQ